MVRANFVREHADTRRQSLIAATAACLAETGARGVSVRSVCRRAGVSAGLLTHYFAGIDDLIAATYAATGAKVADEVAKAVHAAGSNPRARLEAYVTASFRPPVLDPDLLATWLGFWSLVKSDPEVERLHGEINAGFCKGLEDALRECRTAPADPGQLRLDAITLNALIDGLWLELCLDQRGSFDADEACALALKAVGWVLSQSEALAPA